MPVKEVQISEKIHEKLGEAGLQEVCACLWPVDCQTCGRFLGEEPPALCVNDMMVFATASLHHEACRVPQWNDGTLIQSVSGAHASFITRLVMMPLRVGSKEHQVPMLLVNPGLEMVFLEPDEHGRWHVRPNTGFAAAGLTPPGPGARLSEPVEGAIARLTSSSIAVTLQVPPFETYECPAEPVFLEAARAVGGVLLGITHVLHPGELTPQLLHQALAGGHVLVGRVAFHGVKPVAPRQKTAAAVTYVLHWNGRHMSVGKLIGHTPKRLSDKKARTWAKRIIGADDGALIPWQPADRHNPDEGWYTTNALSVEQYFLRRYADGWTLVQAFSRCDGVDVETDNEAKAWAAGVLQFRAGVSGLNWESGPSTPDSTTLYAHA